MKINFLSDNLSIIVLDLDLNATSNQYVLLPTPHPLTLVAKHGGDKL